LALVTFLHFCIEVYLIAEYSVSVIIW